jgi:uncharacterized protein with PIN domain
MTSGGAVWAVCFDASALAKLRLDEDKSQRVVKAFANDPTKYTTPFCFCETLTLLKARVGVDQGARARSFVRASA